MGISDSGRLRSLIFLAFGVFGINFALSIYHPTYTNFLASDLQIDAFQIGALESIREVPGPLSIFILGSLLRFPQPLLAGCALLVFGLGISARAGGSLDVGDQVSSREEPRGLCRAKNET